MGAEILLIAFVVEAAFVTYGVVTHSNRNRVRSHIRIAALAAFGLATLVAGIQWNFTWYLLAALLFIWGILGVLGLLRKPVETKRIRPFPPFSGPLGRCCW